MDNFFDHQITEICEMVENRKYRVVVVEGYDCVGKGRVIEELSKKLDAKVYRPNYNFWESHTLPRSLRWVIGASILDYFSNTVKPDECIIFDRGMLSGAVYNNDSDVMIGYSDLIKNLKVLHVLVTTDKASYERFAELRGEKSKSYRVYLRYEGAFQNLIEENKLYYYPFINQYDEEYADSVGDTCQSCGHYSHNKCNNPKHIKSVKPTDHRCENSKDKEVQDRNE